MKPWLQCALALALVTGCGQSLENLGSFPCAQNGECPSGWVCSAKTCIKIGETPTAERECESDLYCGSAKTCTAVQNGGSVCDTRCIYPGDPTCSGDTDCKLVLSGMKDTATLVAACMGNGSKGVGVACSFANDCDSGLGCREGYCRVLCSSMATCSYGTCRAWSGFTLPSGWGHCLY